MQRKRTLKCNVGEKRWTVVRVRGDAYDTTAGRSFEEAMRVAIPNRGDRVDVFAVCAGDAGAARLPSAYGKRGQLVKSFKYRGGR
jgi:hypothetical protein